MPSLALIYGLLGSMAGFALPLVLLPIIVLTGSSEVVEEVAKAIVVMALIFRIPDVKGRYIAAAVLGLSFGISESLLYAGQIVEFGDIGVLGTRFLLTVPMHVVTVLLMTAFAMRRRWMIVLGVFLSVLVHLAFNILVRP